MNKLLQTALIAALLVAPAFAGENQPITEKVTFENGTSVASGITLSLANGTEAILANGTTIEVMGTLEGPATGKATIKCEGGNATVDLNTLQLKEMENSEITTLVDKNLGYTSEGMTYYHMKPLDEAGKIENRANIIFDNVDVTENSLLDEVQEINDSDKTLLLGSDSETAQNMTLKNHNDEAVEVVVNIANEGYSTPYPLTITGSFDFKGDNTHYTQGTVTFDNSGTAFSEDNSAFQSEMNITNQSTVTFHKPVTLSKDIAVSNSEIVFKELVKLTNGAKLVIGAALTPALTYKITFNDLSNDNVNKVIYGPFDTHYYQFAMYQIEENDNVVDSVVIERGGLTAENHLDYNDYKSIGIDNNNIGISIDYTNRTIDYSNMQEKDSPNSVTTANGVDTGFTYKELYGLFSGIESGNVEFVKAYYQAG